MVCQTHMKLPPDLRTCGSCFMKGEIQFYRHSTKSLNFCPFRAKKRILNLFLNIQMLTITKHDFFKMSNLNNNNVSTRMQIFRLFWHFFFWIFFASSFCFILIKIPPVVCNIGSKWAIVVVINKQARWSIGGWIAGTNKLKCKCVRH